MRAFLLAGLLAASAAHAATGFKTPQDFTLPDGAVKVDEDRYRLSQNWDEALKFYRQVYPSAKYPRHTLRSQSPVRAIHIENAPGAGKWDGANLYETARGEVRVFVLANGQAAEPAPKSK